ncbi:MAG: nicotinate (nicotinamide) nucleotide adenylyltransferase [Candidatus Methylacidiphilales bacterium]|nr:nicotinate (nicotinamide) nucleotide adenylyltransferase [Candidatus Methylacidiphilales bacterium]
MPAHTSAFSKVRLGLFGGTFDPPHWGHYLAARDALEALSLDRVIFLPCRLSPHKSGTRPTPAAGRLRMLKAMLRGEKWAEISRWDMDRPGVCYSYLTAEAFSGLYPGAELFWIMGSDQWEALPRWKHPDRLAAVVHFAVFPRTEVPRPRRGMALHILPSRYDISATRIRERLRRRLPIKGLVPDPVARYIQNQPHRP